MLASAQYFEVFDIDTSEYPIMKAKFYSIDANGKQILNHTPADFEITENGEPRDVISVSCPKQNEDPFSVVIAVDVSSSMSGDRIQNSKQAIKSFIDLMPNNESEVAIIAFNDGNYFISDFSTNKAQLKSKVEGLTAGGATVYSGNPEIGTKEIPLDLSNYANGRYYIKLTNPTITKTEIFEVVR